MIRFATTYLARGAVCLLALLGIPAGAQVFLTQPLYSNPVNPRATTSNAFATPVSGNTYAATNRPVEANSGRFKIDSWSAGMPFSSAPADFKFGDVITPPPLTDLSKAPTVVTTNGAFYMASRKQLIAAQGGSCQVIWPTTSGGSNVVTYSIGSAPSGTASRLFWTDNYIRGAALNTNYNSLPDNTDYAVSLSGIYAKIHYNVSLPDFDPVNSQDTPAGRTSRANNAVSHLDLSAVWIDGNSVLRARNQAGYFILEYFDTSSYANSVGFEVVYCGPAQVYHSAIVLGQRLLPSEGAEVAETLSPSTSKASSYVKQWSASGSHFYNWIFAITVNSDANHLEGDSSKTQILWQRIGNLQVVWPYEPHWYSITWPGDQSAQLFLLDGENPTNSPTAQVPTNYTATVVWAEKRDKVLLSDAASSLISPVGEGRALIQYQNNTDVWFVPVRVAARTNGAFYSNQEVFWPVGVPLQPVNNPPRLQLDGTSTYLSLATTLQPELSLEMWIHPTSVTQAQTLAAFLDYPQQASVQVAFSLESGGLLKLSALTSGSATATTVTSATAITANSWAHVAFTKNSSGKLKLFINGVLDNSVVVDRFNAQSPANATYAQAVFGKPLAINGAVRTNLAGFAGEVREIRLWDTALSESKLKSALATPLTGSEESLAHLLTPRWQESPTPTDVLDTQVQASFLVNDLVTGQLVSGFGTARTAGLVPYGLQNRLSFDGTSNWAQFSLPWNRMDTRTLEFWLVPDSVSGHQSVFALRTSSSTNLQAGLANGFLTLSINGVNLVTGDTPLQVNQAYQVVLTTVAEGLASLYVDGAFQGSVNLAGSNNSLVASSLILGSGFANTEYSRLRGELRDLRVYSDIRSLEQISADRTSTVDLTDPDLIRFYTFDSLAPTTSGSEAVITLADSARGFGATYHGSITFGSDLPGRAPAEVVGGSIRSGTAYHAGIYSTEKRILPLNDTPTNAVMEVWWNNAFTAPYLDQPLQLPGLVTRYQLMDPLVPPLLVVAGQNHTGFPVPTTWVEPIIYYQNDVTLPGYNPNEEHALLIGSTVYALRWDLNSDATSHGYALLQYKDSEKNSLSYFQPIRILSTNATYPNFDATLLVGQLLQPPRPLTDLPKSSLSGPLPNSDLNERLFQDRQNAWWARSAVNSGTADTVSARWYYPLQPGFYWPSNLGTKQPGDPVPFGNTGSGLTIPYTIRWPDVVPHLALGQSLSDAAPSALGDGFLPAVTGQKSVEILYDAATHQSRPSISAQIVDPTNPSSVPLDNLNGINTATDIQLGKTYFTLLPPHLRERVYWDSQTKRLYLTGEIVRPVTGFSYVQPAWLGSGSNTNTDFSLLAGLSSASTWQTAVGALRKVANVIPNAETPFDSVVLMPTGTAGGYVTLGMATRLEFNNTGDPVSLYPIFVDTNILYQGEIKVLFSANKFDQYTSLRHSGDFAGDPSGFTFDWRYTSPVEGQAPTSDPATWILYAAPTAGMSRVVFGGPGLLTLKDTYFSCRWKCNMSGAPNTNWSEWTPPALVQSWLTRAMDGINPFEQRVSSLANNHLDLTTSILSQAGKRFVGAVPLNMDNAVDYGLIETYETLLQQARNLSIDSGYSDDDVNQSLLESASKLNELYSILGDAAFSDSKDPTIAWGSRDLNAEFFGSRASSLFAFQGILPSLLEEELALLRGLDDSTSTPVTTYPVYNRLYWNFTKGISSGEPAYALNYGIPSLVDNEMGSITEADAAKLYPQGHGDAYGHYLTALKSYYRLLNNTNFTWYPRAEVKVIGGVNVTFDYVDERKMAAASLQRSLASVDIVELTYRRDYKLDPAKRQGLFSDSNTNRAWSATEWSDRASQGILYDWMVINSLLPAGSDTDSPQIVSRRTVPELGQLAGLIRTLQDKQDVIDRGDSPMEVAANVVPFDLDPSLLDSGHSHFEQIYTRATAAMQSAYTVLQRASASAANLRRQDVSLESFRNQINLREKEFNAQLIDLYGTPYADDIGPTGTFANGYDGADLYHFSYIDRDIFNPADAGAVTNVSFYSQYSVTGGNMDTLATVGTNISYQVNSDGIPVLPNAWTGRRTVYGKIQGALGDYIQAWVKLRGAVAQQTAQSQQLEARLQRLRDHNAFGASYGAIEDDLSSQKLAADLLQELSDNVAQFLADEKEAAKEVADTSSEAAPKSLIVGLAAGGDLSFPARLGIGLGKIAAFIGFTSAEGIANLSSYAAGKTSTMLDDKISANADALQEAEYQSQTALETTVLLSQANASKDSIYAAAIAFRQAWQTYNSLVTRGNQLQADLVAFRAANAARIQQARYADVVFRTFRNEDLEEYLNAFDQAARYTFATAQVYDYETGLLDPTVVSGQQGDFMGDIMSARQLGDMVNGQPVPGSSGAHSLASVLDRMRANWASLKGRFGINNPTLESHAISLRQELFRIGNSTNQLVQDSNDLAWRNQLYAYKVADLRQVAEFKTFCQLYSPMAVNEPALVIPFSTEISSGKNVFGLPLAGADTAFDPAHFTTKIRGAALSFLNYNKNLANTLTKSPRAYLVPVGIDRQRTPLSGGTEIRDWHVIDQVWPIPYPAASGSVNIPLQNIGTDNMHVVRRFPPMRAYDSDALASAGTVPYDARLVGRSAWNTRWVLIIPASSLSASTETALDSFIQGITDIKLHLETYSYSGN